MVSPTTAETLPGGRQPYAPEPEAEPQPAAPDGVQEQDEADAEPERWLRARRASDRHRDDPCEAEDTTDDRDANASQAKRREHERQCARYDGDHEPGHPGSIGG